MNVYDATIFPRGRLEKTKRWLSAQKFREADPIDVGYQEGWGEHWGPIEYEHDSWTSTKGYHTSSPPMPLPKTLYHATPFVDNVVGEGFKTAKELGKDTLGGHGDYVSLTSWERAAAYAEGLRDIIRMSRGEVSEEDLPSLFDKWGVPEESRQMWVEMARNDAPSGTDEVPFALRVFQYAWIKSDFPLALGITNPDKVKAFAQMDPADVGIVEVKIEQPIPWKPRVNVRPEDMAGHYEFNPSEEEWRIYSPEMISSVREVSATSQWVASSTTKYASII